MSDRRYLRLASTGARMLVGTIVSAAFVVAVVTAVSVPWPTVERSPVRVEAEPAPADTIVSCNGGLLVLGREAQQASAISLAASSAVTVGAGEADSAPTEKVLASPDVVDSDGVPVFSAQADSDVRAAVAAASSSVVSSDDLAGFAASGCRPPLLESWLVGGSGTIGASDLMLISNPGDVASTVQLTVYGVDGAATPPGGTFVLAPRTQRVLPLAGFAFGEESPVVRVTATGAPVQAGLQTSITRTLVPGGVDQTDAVAAPERTAVITGVVIAERDADADATSLVRLLAPSAPTEATVTVTEIGADAPAVAPTTVSLTEGEPAEIALDDLDPGRYTVVVEAEEPIVAAVWEATGLGEGDDFAWFMPAPELATPTLFATPAGSPPRLSIANTSDVDTTVRVTAVDGSFSTEVDSRAGSTSELPLPARGVYLLEPGETPVRAAVTFSSAGALAGFPVWPADAAEPPVVVYP